MSVQHNGLNNRPDEGCSSRNANLSERRFQNLEYLLRKKVILTLNYMLMSIIQPIVKGQMFQIYITYINGRKNSICVQLDVKRVTEHKYLLISMSFFLF